MFKHASDAEIIKNVSGTSHGDTDADDADDADEICEPLPKVAEAVEGLERALKWLEMQEVDYVKILHMRSLLDFAKSKRETGMKQLKVDQFFQRVSNSFVADFQFFNLCFFACMCQWYAFVIQFIPI